MKSNKKNLLILTIVIFAIIGVSLVVVQSRQAQARQKLEQELSLAQSRLGKINNASGSFASRQKELENRLVQARPRLATVKADLHQLIETIEVDDTLFDIAKISGVEIIEISSSAPAEKDLKGVRYSVLTVTVRIEGDINSITKFILQWTEKFRSGVVVSADIKPLKPDAQVQSANQTANQTASQTANQTASQTDNQTASQTDNQTASQTDNQTASQTDNQTVNQSATQTIVTVVEIKESSAVLNLLIYTYRGD